MTRLEGTPSYRVSITNPGGFPCSGRDQADQDRPPPPHPPRDALTSLFGNDLSHVEEGSIQDIPLSAEPGLSARGHRGT